MSVRDPRATLRQIQDAAKRAQEICSERSIQAMPDDWLAGFFVKAGFARPGWWLTAALAIETVVATCLILDLATRAAAIVAAAFLAVAAAATWRVSGRRWYWNFGGPEYCVFWAIACAVVAMAR